MAPRPAPPRRPGTLRPVSRARLYERLLDYTHTERIRVGDRLPAERELAAQLGVSRASVSQALVALEVQGVIDDALSLMTREVAEGERGAAGDKQFHAAVTAAAAAMAAHIAAVSDSALLREG